MEKIALRKIPTIRFGSCGHLAKSRSPSWIISLILKSFVASFLVITTFKTPKKISSIPRVECPVQLFISPWFRFGLGGAHPNSLVGCGEVVKWCITWMFLGISCCFPSKKRTVQLVITTTTSIFLWYLLCVFPFFPSKNPEFPKGWNGCQQQRNGVRPTISQVNPQVNPVPSSVARAVVVASPCGSNETSILASVGWVGSWREGARPQPKRDFPWDETVYLTLFNDPWMVDFYTIQ